MNTTARGAGTVSDADAAAEAEHIAKIENAREDLIKAFDAYVPRAIHAARGAACHEITSTTWTTEREVIGDDALYEALLAWVQARIAARGV